MAALAAAGAGGGRVGGLPPGRGGQRGRPGAVRAAGLRRAPRVPPLPRDRTGGRTLSEARMSPHIPPRSEELRRRFAEAARAERPDLAQLCLLVGAEADGALDEAGMDAAQIELDRLAGQLPFRPGGPRGLGRRRWPSCSATGCGFRGTPADYQRLESSLLHEVLRRRRGLPILLSVVWIEVARRAGAPVYGVALPGHFVVGFGDPRGHAVLADPFDGGRLLTGGATPELLVAGATGAPLDAAMLEPADPLDVVLRILNNIRAWAAARPEQRPSRCGRSSCRCCCPRTRPGCATSGPSCSSAAGDFLAGAAEMEEYAEVVGAVDAAGRRDACARRRGRPGRCSTDHRRRARPGCAGYSQPFSRAIRTASARLRAALLDGRGEVVADRALRQAAAPSAISALVEPSAAARSTSRSRSVSGLAPSASAAAASVGSMTRSPRSTLPYRVGELGRRGVLDEEGVGAGLHRAAQIAGAAEGGEDDDLEPGQCRCAAAPRPRCRSCRASRCPAARRRGRAARAAASTSSPRATWATTSMSGSRPSSAASASRTIDWSSASSTLIMARELMRRILRGAPGRATDRAAPAGDPRKPPRRAAWPAGCRRPLSRRSREAGEAVAGGVPRRGRRRRPPRSAPGDGAVQGLAAGRVPTVQRWAPLCRTTLVTASRSAQASAPSCSAGEVVGTGRSVRGTSAVDAGGGAARRGRRPVRRRGGGAGSR